MSWWLVAVDWWPRLGGKSSDVSLDCNLSLSIVAGGVGMVAGRVGMVACI